jgi:rhodanese-related sulfurtransferase
MFVKILDLWAVWLPLLIIGSLHLFEKTQSQAGVIYPKDFPEIMRKRIQVFSFQTQDQFDQCHIKGAKRIDVTETDPDAFALLLEKKYPVICYCNDGVQSQRYFEHIQSLQKSFWLSGGLETHADKISKWCIWRLDND